MANKVNTARYWSFIVSITYFDKSTFLFRNSVNYNIGRFVQVLNKQRSFLSSAVRYQLSVVGTPTVDKLMWISERDRALFNF